MRSRVEHEGNCRAASGTEKTETDSPKASHQSNGVVENAHCHLEGLLRTMRSDLMEKTGVNVNVKSLLAS